MWKECEPFRWSCRFICGNSISYSKDGKEIILYPNKKYMISATFNISNVSGRGNVGITLNSYHNGIKSTLFEYFFPQYGCISSVTTISANNYLFDTCGYINPVSITYELSTHNYVNVCSAYLSVVEH